MIKHFRFFRTSVISACFVLITVHAFSFPPGREFYELIIYNMNSEAQEKQVDAFLEQAFLPALHRTGIKSVGVFKPIGNDTASTRRIYVLIPFDSYDKLAKVYEKLDNDRVYLEKGMDYLQAPFDRPPYSRMERIHLLAFSHMPRMQPTAVTGPKSERVYELRSYESANESLHKKKVKMFNEGGEVTLFKRLGFNAVFYGQVIAGCHMPNLMYMTTFENRQVRDEHWKAFGADPEWKQLSAKEEYKNTVSKNTSFFLYPVAYSDY
jgi:hypothetical protein